MSDRRLPPHDLDAEEAVLGAVLVDARRVWNDVTTTGLDAECFYRPAHQQIFEAAAHLHAVGHPVDTITVTDELRRLELLDSVGGPGVLHALQNCTPSISGAAHYAVIILDACRRRSLIATAADITDAAYTGSDTQAIEAAMRALSIAALTPRGHGFVPIDEIRTEAIRWAWEGFVPAGEVTLLAGYEKVGKSCFCGELVARASQGQLEGDWYGSPVPCLYLTAEDRVSHVVVPRLQLAGADRQLVMVEPPGSTQPVTLARITAAIRAGVRLVVLDPLVLFLDDLDDENTDLKVRSSLAPVIHLAQETDTAIVGIKHTNKAEGKSILNRVAGSRGYTAAVRAILFAADDPESPDPTNPDRLLYAKGNLAASMLARRYHIEGQPVLLDDGNEREHARIVWKGNSTVQIEDAFARSDRPGAAGGKRPGEHATEFLLDVLADGPVLAVDVKQAARDADISIVTLKRAKQGLGVESRREGFGRGSQVWWALPEDDRQDRSDDDRPTGPVHSGSNAPIGTRSANESLWAGTNPYDADRSETTR